MVRLAFFGRKDLRKERNLLSYMFRDILIGVLFTPMRECSRKADVTDDCLL
jgi:hypothetical protein